MAACIEDVYYRQSQELVGGTVSTRDGAPLNASLVRMSILSSSITSAPASTVWLSPTVATQVTSSSVKAQVMIGPGQTYDLVPGRYRVWFKILDSPETPWLASPSTFRVV